MMANFIKIACFLVFVYFVCSVCAEEVEEFTAEDITAILQTVPEENRDDFLRFQINHGYDLVENNYVAYSKINPTVSVQIYNYFKQNNSISSTELAGISDTQLKTVICFEWGCIDYDDPSIHP